MSDTPETQPTSAPSASDDTPVVCTPDSSHASKRFSTADIGLMVKFRQEGKTDTEIAQRFGCSRQNVNYHLQEFSDSTRELAEIALDASLLNDARRLNDLAENGKPDEAIKAIRTKWQARKMLDSDKSNTINQIAVVLGVSIAPPLEAKVTEVVVSPALPTTGGVRDGI